jgi:hypothetical protein
MRDLAEEGVGWAKAGRELVDRRMMEGTGCFFRKELDLHFLIDLAFGYTIAQIW